MLAFTIDTPSAKATMAAALAIGRLAKAGDLFVLDGLLGAGKTTFTKGFAEAFEVRGNISSPTFVISRLHPALGSGPDLLHVDAYRLDEQWEVEDLDLDSDLSHSVTLVEWGRTKVEHLSDSYALVELKRAETFEQLNLTLAQLGEADYGDEERNLTITFFGPRFENQQAQISEALLSAGFKPVEIRGEE